MKQSDLKILIKKVQNECALEEPTKITYYWNDEGKLVFKLFFDSLIIPEELMVDEDNISKCFSEQNVYEFEDDFVIKELNREKGFVEIIPDDQKFKVINSYKDYNEDEKVEKDPKEESVVRLAGNRISEDFARTKGFILKESEDPNSVKAGSKSYMALVFNIYLLNDHCKNEFVNFLDSLLCLVDTSKSEHIKLPMKLFFNIPQSAAQFAGFQTNQALHDILLEYSKSRNINPQGSYYILNSKSAKDIAEVADKQTSVYYTFEQSANDVALKTGLANFANPKGEITLLQKLVKEDTPVGGSPEKLYKAFLDESKKSYDKAVKDAEFIIKGYLKHLETKEKDNIMDNFKTMKPQSWKMGESKYKEVVENKNDPTDMDLRIMKWVENVYTHGENVADIDRDSAKNLSNAYKNAVSHLDRYKLWDHGFNAAWNQAYSDLNDARDALFAKFLTDKSAGASEVKGDVWQKTDMEKGASAAGVDFGKAKDIKKTKQDIFNGMMYLNIYTFFPENDGSRKNIANEFTLTTGINPQNKGSNSGTSNKLNNPKNNKTQKGKKDKH